MGRSKVMRGGPLLCFNAGNHWQLGWFPNGRKDFGYQGPTVPQKFDLASFVDYPGSHPVIARVGDMYMQYNYRKSYNKDSDALVNQLVIVYLGGDKKTMVKGNLGVHQEYSDAGSSFVVKVCSQSTKGGANILTLSVGRSYTDCNSSASSGSLPSPSFSWNKAPGPTTSFWSPPSPTPQWPPSGSIPSIKWGSGSSQSTSGWSNGFKWSSGQEKTSNDYYDQEHIGESTSLISTSAWSSFDCILGRC